MIRTAYGNSESRENRHENRSEPPTPGKTCTPGLRTVHRNPRENRNEKRYQMIRTTHGSKSRRKSKRRIICMENYRHETPTENPEKMDTPNDPRRTWKPTRIARGNPREKGHAERSGSPAKISGKTDARNDPKHREIAEKIDTPNHPNRPRRSMRNWIVYDNLQRIRIWSPWEIRARENRHAKS